MGKYDSVPDRCTLSREQDIRFNELANRIKQLTTALNGMYVATRDHHRGALPPAMQAAYSAAAEVLFKDLG